MEYSIEQLEQELGMTDVSKAFDEVSSAENEIQAKTGMEQLMDRYKEMLEQESDWVQLFNQPLAGMNYYLAIVNIKLDINFILSANVNIALVRTWNIRWASATPSGSIFWMGKPAPARWILLTNGLASSSTLWERLA